MSIIEVIPTRNGYQVKVNPMALEYLSAPTSKSFQTEGAAESYASELRGKYRHNKNKRVDFKQFDDKFSGKIPTEKTVGQKLSIMA